MSRFVFGFFSLVSERLDIGRGINLPFSHVLLIPPDGNGIADGAEKPIWGLFEGSE